jgi:hypothetical protein
MNHTRFLRGLSALAIITVAGCHSLDITNNNDPDRTALKDPVTLEALGGGSLRTFFNAYLGLRSAGVLSTQARTFSASWNNGNLNFYSGIDVGANDLTKSPATWNRNTRTWQYDPAAAGRTSVEAFWNGGNDESAITRPGMYAALSAANAALGAIRNDGVSLGDPARTKRMETVAVLMQGIIMAQISLNYDKGYIVDENSDLATLQYSDRKAIRDAAIAKLAEAATLAGANTFTTPAAWANGKTYTNVQIAQLANTIAAMTRAWYPRDDTETGTQVDWNAVLTLTASGMPSTMTFGFNGDGGGDWSDEILIWCNSLDTCRISTRLAHFLDPATQRDPYPLGVGNPQPNSPDARLGDGSFGNDDMVDGFGNVPEGPTTNAGTDFAWSEQGEIQRPDRGFYQQSNIGQIRFDETRTQDGDAGVYGGYGYMPVFGGAINDLLRAEALLRVNAAANAAAAAALIDKTRVTRGNLPSSALLIGNIGSPADGPCMTNGLLAKNGSPCTLWSALLYEFEIEMLGFGPAPFYVHRHLPVVQATAWEQVAGTIFNGPRYIQGLLPGTPREMPVPAKELGVRGEALYTYGGASAAHSATP